MNTIVPSESVRQNLIEQQRKLIFLLLILILGIPLV